MGKLALNFLLYVESTANVEFSIVRAEIADRVLLVGGDRTVACEGTKE